MHLPFPTDFERVPGVAWRPGRARVPLPASPLLQGPGRDVPRVLAAVVALLHRWTDHEAVTLDVFGPDGASRRLRCGCTGPLPFEDLVGAVASALATATAVPGEGPGPNVAVAWDPPGALAREGAWELCVVLETAQEPRGLSVVYNQHLFLPSSMERLLASLGFVLGGLAALRPCQVDELPTLDPAARAELLRLLDSGPAPDAPLFLASFAHAVREHPDALAARHLETTLTYRALEARAEQLAAHLLDRGLRPGDLVAVCVRPSVDIVVAIVALFKARLVYLPLDPTHPPAFVRHMVEEARPRLVLLHAALAELECFAGQALLPIDQPLPPGHATRPAELDLSPRATDGAYVFYTSGTTGKPKGVVATQANLAHYLHAARSTYGFRPGDVSTSIARYTFSISLFDLLSPLAVGGAVRLLDRDTVLSPEALARVLDGVTVVHAGPSLLANFFRYLKGAGLGSRTWDNVRHISSGGDLVPASVMEELKRVFPRAEIFVIYGCTEVSCMGTTFPVSRGEVIKRSYVGRPFPGVGLRVLDARQQLVPVGVLGEICFGGPGLVSGYLGRPELDAQKFLPLDGQRFYRTGDVGRLNERGDLEMLGRRDDQVQLRGIRLELAGIENTVRELGLAAQCAFVHKKTLDDERLVAFVVGPKDRDVKGFRRALSLALPEYMLPQHLVVLDKMPLTTNGKLDRRALAALPWGAEVEAGGTTGTAPRTDEERALAAIYQRLLGRAEVGVDQDFFDLGGHSLLAVMAITEISQTLGRPVRPQDFFQNGTIAGLLAAMGGAGARTDRPILLNEHGGRPALFMLSGLHIYRPLARALEGRFACFGVFADAELAPLQGNQATTSVEELAREYLRLIRAQQPAGPYHLLGYSFAGIVTYEVAQVLRRAGEEVRLLVLLDATLPEWLEGWRFRARQLRRLFAVAPGDVVHWAVKRLQRRGAGPQLAEPRYQGDDTLGPFEALRDEVNGEAAARYYHRLTRYPGPVLVISSRTRLRADPLKSPACGWEPFIPHLVQRQVDGDHFAMVEQPGSVRDIARSIEEHWGAT